MSGTCNMSQEVDAQELTEQGLHQILVDVIEEVKQAVDKNISGAEVLYGLLNSPWILSLLKAYECLHKFQQRPPAPALNYASGLSLQLLIDIRAVSGSSHEAMELYGLLRLPHLQALLSAHDTVAQKDYETVLPPVPEDLPEDEEATRTVCLVKNKQPLGATIKRNEVTGEIFVARIIHGGLADRSGLLHAGDRIIEVNGFPVVGMEPEQVIQFVQARSQGTIMFKVVPITERTIHSKTMLYVRAMADYSPQQDPTIPCADAGMSFRRGDILEIVDQTDALWWQAKKLPSTTDCAGLIPSSTLLKSSVYPIPRLPEVSTVDEEEDMIAIDERCVEGDEEAFESEELHEEEGEFSSSIKGVFIAGFRRSLRLCRRRSHSTSQASGHGRCPGSCYSAVASPYEEVVRYQRQPLEPRRLIALIGPSGVGLNELRRALIEVDPYVFQGPVPHSTRVPKSYEESGREYHFTSREVFDNMVYNNRFLEYGDYKGHMYGTSIRAVRDVLNSGKICVIDIEPNAIQAVRTHELQAYIIYVKPPPAEQFRETRQNSLITTNYYVDRPFKDEDFQEIEEAARKMEYHYCQFFDQVIVNGELQDSCAALLTAARKAQDEPQWVPATWIRPVDES